MCVIHRRRCRFRKGHPKCGAIDMCGHDTTRRDSVAASCVYYSTTIIMSVCWIPHAECAGTKRRSGNQLPMCDAYVSVCAYCTHARNDDMMTERRPANKRTRCRNAVLQRVRSKYSTTQYTRRSQTIGTEKYRSQCTLPFVRCCCCCCSTALKIVQYEDDNGDGGDGGVDAHAFVRKQTHNQNRPHTYERTRTHTRTNDTQRYRVRRRTASKTHASAKNTRYIRCDGCGCDAKPNHRQTKIC